MTHKKTLQQAFDEVFTRLLALESFDVNDKDRAKFDNLINNHHVIVSGTPAPSAFAFLSTGVPLVKYYKNYFEYSFEKIELKADGLTIESFHDIDMTVGINEDLSVDTAPVVNADGSITYSRSGPFHQFPSGVMVGSASYNDPAFLVRSHEHRFRMNAGIVEMQRDLEYDVTDISTKAFVSIALQLGYFDRFDVVKTEVDGVEVIRNAANMTNANNILDTVLKDEVSQILSIIGFPLNTSLCDYTLNANTSVKFILTEWIPAYDLDAFGDLPTGF